MTSDKEPPFCGHFIPHKGRYSLNCFMERTVTDGLNAGNMLCCGYRKAEEDILYKME